MTLLVERMLKLHKDLPKARTAPDKTAIERQVAAMDRQIDQLGYELCGLTRDDVRIDNEKRNDRQTAQEALGYSPLFSCEMRGLPPEFL